MSRSATKPKRRVVDQSHLPPTANPFLDCAAAAAMTAIGKSSLRRLVLRGLFPPPDGQIGRSPRWKLSTIQQWIDSGPKIAEPLRSQS